MTRYGAALTSCFIDASLRACHLLSIEVEQAWYDEAGRRLAELDSGEAVEVPAEEVFRSLGVSEKR